jgi:hypothetical protein
LPEFYRPRPEPAGHGALAGPIRALRPIGAALGNVPTGLDLKGLVLGGHLVLPDEHLVIDMLDVEGVDVGRIGGPIRSGIHLHRFLMHLHHASVSPIVRKAQFVDELT